MPSLRAAPSDPGPANPPSAHLSLAPPELLSLEVTDCEGQFRIKHTALEIAYQRLALPSTWGGVTSQQDAAPRATFQTPGQVPGLGRSILGEPPTGTPGKVATMMVSVEPVFTASRGLPGRSMNDWPCVYLVTTQWFPTDS